VARLYFLRRKDGKIAAGILEGKSLAQIGGEEGISRQPISNQLVSTDARRSSSP
jgi:DNA-binding CsgD family transcriptional regulator